MALDDGFEGQEQSGIAEATKLEFPPDYKVVLYNDDYTTKEFVVEILETVFHKETSDAVEIMESVHNKGKGVAGIYTYDIAVTRAALTVQIARQNGFPLRCEAEPC
ncbi:MAG: ATP-dependent Clp protease adaptor ClpS [Treponema sp.]